MITKNYKLGAWIKDYMKFVVLILCALFCYFCFDTVNQYTLVNAKWSSHTSSPGDPVDGYYRVYSPEQLAYCAQHNYSNIMIMNHLDLSKYQWIPFGTSTSSPWSGTFDGNGFEISGLTITKNYSYAVAGLFGAVNNTSTIKNVILSNINISLTQSDTDAGAVVTYPLSNSTVTVSNCSAISGSITIRSFNYTSYHCGVGGIVGYNRANLTIKNCHNNISITHQNNMKTDCSANAGGILGATIDNCTVNILGCSNTGTIKSIEYDRSSYSHSAGGILGYNTGSTVNISDCGNWGEIFSGDDESDHESGYDEDGNYYEYLPYYVQNAYAGGIVGGSVNNSSFWASLNCSNSFNRGNIESECDSTSDSEYTTNTHTGWTGDVLNLAYWAGGYSGVTLPYVGGAGNSQKKFSHSLASIYTNSKECYSGGIAGYTSSSSILSSYNTGSIASSGFKTVSIYYPLLLMSCGTFTSPYEFGAWVGTTGQTFNNWSAINFRFDITLSISKNVGDITGNQVSCTNCYGTQFSSSLYSDSSNLRISYERANVIYMHYGANANSDKVNSTEAHPKRGSLSKSFNFVSEPNQTYYLNLNNANLTYLNKVSIYNSTYKKWQDYSPPRSSTGPDLTDKRIEFKKSGNILSVYFKGNYDNYELSQPIISTQMNAAINWTTKTSDEMKNNSIIDSCLGTSNWKIDSSINDGFPVPKGLYF